MSKEWYMQQYEDMPYLHNQKLSLRSFPCIEGAHDHCELCWERFSMYSSDQHSGYYETKSKSWICNNCYNQFAALFGWTVDKTDL